MSREGTTKIIRKGVMTGTFYSLDSIEMCFHTGQIYHVREKLVSEAKDSIDLITYRWRFRRDPSLFLSSFAEGFKRMRPGVKVRVLVNRTVWTETHKSMKRDFARTFAFWKSTGVDLTQLTIEVRTWNHYLLNNIHEKFLLVDNDKVLIRSSNIEDYSSGSKGSWREVGCAFKSEEIGKRLKDRFNVYWEKANPLKVALGNETEAFNYQPPLAVPPCLKFENISAQLFFQNPRASPFSTNHSSLSTSALLYLLDSAKESIDIMTPNFNDLTVLAVLRCKVMQGVQVRLMCCHHLNADYPILQKYFLGYRSNKQMWQEFLYDIAPLFQCKYYTKRDTPNIPTFRKEEDVVHAKMIVVDGHRVAMGSVNVDVFSLVNSGELLFLLHSKEIGKACFYFFNSLWKAAIPMGGYGKASHLELKL
jgi:phosphatidylserine/phosphatidylglycerophosphate/cardiolipin synthase-like enzyme